jgi:ABC-type multidrug transport system ATPase subunit/ABC-type multidrug transport system permease subunit
MVVPGTTKGMILPFEPLSISFDNISYYVDMPAEMKVENGESRLKLLYNITGSFRPGVLTALVGVSGAGKTTLMDVLAGRKTGGYIDGDIRISGYPKNQKTFARVAGYCEQNDIHSPAVTVYESLVYSAWLRLSPDVADEDKMKFVDEVMDLVELNALRDALVGLPGISGLSTEQRKRLTIAVELVANPSIIFMDEPTSGLDARAAAIVMRTVRNTVDTGRTVVCTIHQPSIDIFEAFDELLLLKRGGRVIYNGSLGHNSVDLIEYFQSLPGVAPIKEGYNPATWMLEVTSNQIEQQNGVDFADIYEKSDLFQRNRQLVEDLKTPAPDSQDLFFPTQYSQPSFNQLKNILWKQFITYWRSPDYNIVRFSFTFVTALIFGSLFWQVGTTRSSSSDLFTIMGALYGSTLFISFNNCGSVQPVVSIERTVFYREKAAGMYSAMPYALAQTFVEVPYVLIQAVMYSLITYSMIGFEWTAPKFFWFLYILFFSLITFTYYGMMMVAITPNAQLATICASFFYSLFNLFSGFLITKPKIPVWWIWYYWICPIAWTLNGLISSQFGDVTTTLTVSGSPGSNPTVKAYVESYFGFKHSFLKYVAIMEVFWPVFFASIFILAIKYLNFQNR